MAPGTSEETGYLGRHQSVRSGSRARPHRLRLPESMAGKTEIKIGVHRARKKCFGRGRTCPDQLRAAVTLRGLAATRTVQILMP